jgi:hypothetical protein
MVEAWDLGQFFGAENVIDVFFDIVCFFLALYWLSGSLQF